MRAILVVTGSRAPLVGFTVEDVHAILDDHAKMHGTPDVLYHGEAHGVDSAADRWAKTRGVRTLPFPVTREEWDRIGPPAGPIRNGRMIAAAAERYDAGDSVIVVAFPGGKGTNDCTRKARSAGLRIARWATNGRGWTLHGETATRKRP